MSFLNLGGPVMWVLVFVSIATLALIIERAIVHTQIALPRGLTPLSTRRETLAIVEATAGLKTFAAVIAAQAFSDEAASLAGQEIIDQLERRLNILNALAKTATLLGLLGTVLGMIETFSAIASSAAGIDMTALAGGLWQALLTTAAGLVIAIPAGLALVFFEDRTARMSHALTLAAIRAREGGGA